MRDLPGSIQPGPWPTVSAKLPGIKTSANPQFWSLLREPPPPGRASDGSKVGGTCPSGPCRLSLEELHSVYRSKRSGSLACHPRRQLAPRRICQSCVKQESGDLPGQVRGRILEWPVSILKKKNGGNCTTACYGENLSLFPTASFNGAAADWESVSPMVFLLPKAPLPWGLRRAFSKGPPRVGGMLKLATSILNLRAGGSACSKLQTTASSKRLTRGPRGGWSNQVGRVVRWAQTSGPIGSSVARMLQTRVNPGRPGDLKVGNGT